MLSEDHLKFKQSQVGYSHLVGMDRVETILGLDSNGDYIREQVPILSTEEIKRLRILLERFEHLGEPAADPRFKEPSNVRT